MALGSTAFAGTWAWWGDPSLSHLSGGTQATLDLQNSWDSSPSGSCTAACVKWAGGHNPVPIRQMSTSQRERRTQHPTWQRGGRTGHGNGTDLFCPTRLRTRSDGGKPEGVWQVGCQQLSEENSMFIDPSNPLQNTSEHFSDIVSFIVPRSHVFKNGVWLPGPHRGCLLSPPPGY